jgi:hypothetical protein
MKKYTIIFFAFILTFVFCDDEDSSEVQYCDAKASASKAKDCEKLKLDEEDYKCCYFKGKLENKNRNTCVGIRKAEYDDIKKTIKDIEKDSRNKVDKLDCNSSYLKYSLISLLLILL